MHQTWKRNNTRSDIIPIRRQKIFTFSKDLVWISFIAEACIQGDSSQKGKTRAKHYDRSHWIVGQPLKRGSTEVQVIAANPLHVYNQLPESVVNQECSIQNRQTEQGMAEGHGRAVCMGQASRVSRRTEYSSALGRPLLLATL